MAGMVGEIDALDGGRPGADPEPLPANQEAGRGDEQGADQSAAFRAAPIRNRRVAMVSIVPAAISPSATGKA